MALKSAFSENRRGSSKAPTVNNLLSLDLHEEDEPLIDLTEDWERAPTGKLSDLDLTVDNAESPQSGNRKQRSTIEEGLGQGKLSPWSKPFSPRTIAASDQYRQPDLASVRAQSQTVSIFESSNEPAAQHAFERPSGVFSPRKRIPTQHTLVYRPSSQSNPNPPYAYPLVTPSKTIVHPKPKALFVPPTPKPTTLRAPEPTVLSTAQLPETPTKRMSGGNAACFPRSRIVLPCEDDYDSDDDPFFPAVHRKTYPHEEDCDSRQKEGPHLSDAPVFQPKAVQRNGDIDNVHAGNSDGLAGDAPASGIPPDYGRSLSLGIGHHPKDAFGEKHDASVVCRAVLRYGSGVSYRPAHGILADDHRSNTTSNTAMHTHWRERVATEPIQHRSTTLDSHDPAVHARQRSEYNFTICRAHLRNLACPYGSYCCFKHPSSSDPIDPDSMLAAEREMGWREQAQVNFGKIRGLLSTGTCDTSEEDQASIVLLFADSVCQNAASHVKPLEAVSPGLKKEDEGADDRRTTILQEEIVLRRPSPEFEGLLVNPDTSVGSSEATELASI